MTTRILIAEDNAFNADMLTRRLARRGYEITLATDGLQAVAAARDGLPDLILMDVGLPEIDGLEASRRLKADAATRHIPIIALTAHAMVSDRQASFDAGCSEFETKPVDLTRLLEKVERLLSGRCAP